MVHVSSDERCKGRQEWIALHQPEMIAKTIEMDVDGHVARA